MGRGEAAGDGEDFSIWPDNAETLEVFLACATQWRVLVTPSSLIRLGLDYTGVREVMRMRGVKNKHAAQAFNELQNMEFAALEEFNRAV